MGNSGVRMGHFPLLCLLPVLLRRPSMGGIIIIGFVIVIFTLHRSSSSSSCWHRHHKRRRLRIDVIVVVLIIHFISMLLVVALIVLTAEWLLVSVMIRGRCFETASVVSYAAVAFVIMLPCEGGNLDLFRLDRLDSNDEVGRAHCTS